MSRKLDIWLTERGLARIEAWRRNGCTVDETAANMGVHRDTLFRWKRENPEIAKALERGASDFDDEVEDALMRAAIGYDYEEDVLDKDGFVHTVTKHQPANVTAMIFWLKNRRPGTWREKREVDVNASLAESQAKFSQLVEQLDEAGA